MTKAIDTWHSNDRTIKSEEIAKVNFNSVCLSFSSINSNCYPGSRGSFSKYLWWNEPCSREKAPESDLWSHKQATVTFSSRRFAPHCRGRDRELSAIRYEKNNIEIPSLFQALRSWGRRERKRHAKSLRGANKEKGAAPARPSFLPFYFRVCASQFSGPNFLRSWNRLRDPRLGNCEQRYLDWQWLSTRSPVFCVQPFHVSCDALSPQSIIPDLHGQFK